MGKKLIYISLLGFVFFACRKEVIVPNNARIDGNTKNIAHPCFNHTQTQNAPQDTKNPNTPHAKALQGDGNGNEVVSGASGAPSTEGENGITDPNNDEDYETGTTLGGKNAGSNVGSGSNLGNGNGTVSHKGN